MKINNKKMRIQMNSKKILFLMNNFLKQKMNKFRNK